MPKGFKGIFTARSLRAAFVYLLQKNYSLDLASFPRFLAIPYSKYGQVLDVLLVSSSILLMLP